MSKKTLSLKKLARPTTVAGKNLLRLRLIHELSQEELAQKAGISAYTISKTECGETTPNLVTACRLAEVLNVAPRDLLGEKATARNRQALEQERDNLLQWSDNLEKKALRLLEKAEELDGLLKKVA